MKTAFKAVVLIGVVFAPVIALFMGHFRQKQPRTKSQEKAGQPSTDAGQSACWNHDRVMALLAGARIIWLTMTLALFLSAGQANGQVPMVSPAWKAHFTSTPVISNCVFEEKTGQTGLFQFRWQPNAFLCRQIGSLAEASSNQIPVTPHDHVSSVYVGRFEQDAWAIELLFHPCMLHLFPNAGNIWDMESTDAEEANLFIGKSQLSQVLYYGIGSLGAIDPATVKWVDDTHFTVLRAYDGKQISGNITSIANGLPTGLEWRIATFPEGFRVEYRYDNQGFDLPYFPSEIRTFSKDFMKGGGEGQLESVITILILKTSSAPLAESFFDPKTYYVLPPTSGLLSSIIMHTNRQQLISVGGHLERVLSRSEFLQKGGLGASAEKATWARYAFLGFLTLSVIVLAVLGRRWIHHRSSN